MSLLAGEIRQRVELAENRVPFALMLGGPDRRTLFLARPGGGQPTTMSSTSTG